MDAATTATAGYAFDSLAESYEASFTDSLIGRAQRNAVWRVLEKTFIPGDRVLELNCGTGEDAIFLARRGVSLVCLDASPRMIDVANRRIDVHLATLNITFSVMPTESIRSLKEPDPFDGVLSNFSGLNCVENLARVAQDLASLTRPRASAVLCLSTRFCLWEFFFYGLQGFLSKATRRWTGVTTANLNGQQFPIRYPTVKQVQRSFAPWFELRHIKGIGIAVPPSYVERWAKKHPTTLHCMEQLDRHISSLPVFRIIGDHVLLVFERTAS